MIYTYPKEFTDFIKDLFGLEWVDYNNNECYREWCDAKCSGTLEEMKQILC